MTALLSENELLMSQKYQTKLPVGSGVAVVRLFVKWKRALGRRIPRIQFAQWGL